MIWHDYACIVLVTIGEHIPHDRCTLSLQLVDAELAGDDDQLPDTSSTRLRCFSTPLRHAGGASVERSKRI